MNGNHSSLQNVYKTNSASAVLYGLINKEKSKKECIQSENLSFFDKEWQIEQTANFFHEAGHAVVAIWLGMEIRSIDVEGVRITQEWFRLLRCTRRNATLKHSFRHDVFFAHGSSVPRVTFFTPLPGHLPKSSTC
ncbi:MAG: hypothetical protein JWM68_1289 [Verrucomicrobiales bacterium]|nr:hypothetical protein [Verrucomicrobiales bacterium]